MEDFGEISARLRLLHPACFRPRRTGSDFHVCPLQAVGNARFDPRTNAITAELVDTAGDSALLVHPWTQRGRSGADALLAELQSGARPLFIAGHVSPGLVFHPTALVFAGDSRRIVLPWIGTMTQGKSSVEARHLSSSSPRIYAQATELLADLILQGANRLRQRHWPGWLRGINELEATGHHRMASMLRQIQTAPGDAIAALKFWRLGIAAITGIGED